MYCGSRTIAIASGDTAKAFPLRCRSWRCPTCAPKRRWQLIQDGLAGEPNRFVTLTVNPHWGDSPEARGAALARAWRDYVREWRRQRPSGELHYMAVLELTKRGEPHLHIIVRGGFIPQKHLSAFMARAIGAPVVDVRMVREKSEVASYVAKYISKRPIRLGTLKRYWRSTKFLPDAIREARKQKKDYRALWMIDADIDTVRNLIGLTVPIVLRPRPDLLQWTMYSFERAPPVPSNMVQRLR